MLLCLSWCVLVQEKKLPPTPKGTPTKKGGSQFQERPELKRKRRTLENLEIQSKSVSVPECIIASCVLTIVMSL
jgi:hypothetical protein